jgi:phage shock protein PspC (stress-responsive transcriptional regulator)
VDLAPPPADAAAAPDHPSPGAQDPDPPERIVGGVAALLAERLDIDALWIRIAFVLLALVGLVGVVVYGALWLTFVVGADPDRRWARLAGGAVLVGGLPLLLTAGFSVLDGPLAVLALLAGLAVALWQPRGPLRPVSSYPSVPRAAPARPAAPPDVDATGLGGASSAWDRRPRLPPRERRPPSLLGRTTLGIAVLVAAGGALIDQLNGGRLHPEQWLGAAAVVCGCGLVAGAFVGRARWLVVPAALLAGTGFTAGEAARVGVRPSALVGDEYVHVGADSLGGRTIREHVVMGTVDVTIDGAPSSPVTVDARSGIGDVRVFASDEVTVEVRAETDHGVVDVRGERRPDGSFTVGPERPPDVVVVARVGRGDVYVGGWTGMPAIAPRVDLPGAAQQHVAEGVALTTGGRFVLGTGEAVIDADDTVLTGAATVQDRVTLIATAYGEFQLLPGGLLLTPYGELLDLHALRGDLAATGEAGTDRAAPDPAGSAPSVPTAPTVPMSTPGG